MKCTQCNAQFDGNFCPNCGAPVQADTPATERSAAPTKTKNPIYKKWWFWVIIAVVAIGLIGSINGGNESTVINPDSGSSAFKSGDKTENDTTDSITDRNTDSETDSIKITVADFSTMSKADIENWSTTNNVTVKFSEEYSDSVTLGSVISQSKSALETVKEGSTIYVVLSKGKKPSVEFQNALKKAESYSKLMHMSKQKIYDQLTSEYGEKFPADAAQYAIDNLDVDYNANALEKADSYSKTMHMSKQRIFDQLTSEYGEQFTQEEAQYAIDNLSADYKANALEKAKSYQETMNMSKDRIYSQLTSEYGEGFTAEEAQYAIDNLDD